MRIVALALALAAGQQVRLPAQEAPSTFVDENGVMRWTASRKEVAQFGVNYTAPFAYSFRAHKRLGIPIEKAIDADVYHFARLGLDAYRVHVWDREISDPAGNLVVNEHVEAFDYLLARLKERGIKIILTAMQFGDNGYPEGGTPADGFSRKYGKQGCLENKESWPLQERYLTQFMNHVNPHTGMAYRNDPDILAFEICNEPGHWERALTVDYINSMTKAIRDTGCGKPVLYNMSHGLPVFQAYLDANVQGGTFQWYPSGLVAGHEQRGNFLPYVDDYPVPFAGNGQFRSKAKIFYEFDSADIGRSYIYPAMARSMRKAGAQFATQFAYDPMYLAAENTEYQTHYLNLAYAPQKALSMKVAGEAFRRVPLYADYGEYPGNTAFERVRVSYSEDLAELATHEKFFYTNRTSTNPPAPERLAHVAGYGSSPIVDYPGQGAYFLDRLESGVWRLEVMPDAIWIRDPFEKASPRKQVSVIAWNEWPMRINLPDLGAGFKAIGLNDGNGFSGRADGQTLSIRPGAYLLTRVGATTRWGREDRWENIALKEFVAPASSIDRTYVLHKPVVEAPAGENLRVTAEIASPRAVEGAELVAYLPRPPFVSDQRVPPNRRPQPGGGPLDDRGILKIAMTRTSGFGYSAEIPGGQLQPGTLRYHIAVKGTGGYETFPSAMDGLPTDWDYYGEPWTARIVPAGAPILLFSAATDSGAVTADHRGARYDIVPAERPGTSAMAVLVGDLGLGEHDHSFRFYFRDRINGRGANLGLPSRLVLFGKSATDQPCPLQVALITADGIAYGGMVSVQPGFGACEIPISALRKVRSPNIPHGYPVFLHYWSSVGADTPLDMNRAESVLVSIGPGIPASEYGAVHGVDIGRIWLE
ncbi:MAG TPA: hypothetical protein VN775_12025 [Opitutaceae bacterium]|nr:hypothetical protein [Opitutaceae bacterium]